MPALTASAQRPTVLARVAVAVGIATVAAPLAYLEPSRLSGVPGDFSQVWFGAVALLQGLDPYHVIGPNQRFHHEFPFLYPLVASIAVLPLGFLKELHAGVIFIWLSTAVLAWGITRDGWHRLPLFLSSAFVIAVRRVQWTPLLTAAACLPWLSWTFVLKPNIGLALLVAAPSRRVVRAAVIGGTIAVAASVLVIPRWPFEWFAIVSRAGHVGAPIAQTGGFLVLLALLRWRRWEARLIVALAFVPQSLSWYDVLPLLLIAQTFRQSLILSLVTSCGFLFQRVFIDASNIVVFTRQFGALMVAFAYLPALLLVLRRPNEGPVPAWLEHGIGSLHVWLRSAAPRFVKKN